MGVIGERTRVINGSWRMAPGWQKTTNLASVSAPMAPSFFLAVSAARRAAHTGQEADRNHSRRCPRDIRPPEPLHCPVDIRPVDILAQRQDFWIARPTLKAIDQEQSLATVHHAIAGSLGHEIFRSPGTTCRSMRRLRDSQNTCCLMGGRASLPVAADRRRGARSGR